MKKRALIIGYGSIGARHCEVLRQLGCETAVVSKHFSGDTDHLVYKEISEGLARFDPAYVVIATPTDKHAQTLREVLADDFVCRRTFLLEKPVYSSSAEQCQIPENSRIAVGYVLRAHPLLRRMTDILAGKKLYSCHAYCGQYLPTWRTSDYRRCYSAHRAGGGVLRDLSHELDYLMMIAGNWTTLTATGGHYSDLEIESDDAYGILFQTEKCPLCHCHIDYLSRMPRREVQVEYEGGSVKLDFITGKLVCNGIEESVQIERNELFRVMHREVLAGDFSRIADYRAGLNVLNMIEQAEKAAEGALWIKKQ